MINLSGIVAHEVDKTGQLPQKFKDLAIREKVYEWYQKYAVIQQDDGRKRVSLFGPDTYKSWHYILNDSALKTGKVFNLINGKSYVFQTKIVGVKQSGFSGATMGISWSSDYSQHYIQVYGSSINTGIYYSSMGYEAGRMDVTSNEVWLKIEKGGSPWSGKTEDYLCGSNDGVNWTQLRRSKHTYSTGSYLESLHIKVQSLDNISFPDTKLIVDGKVWFDGAKSQRIS